MFETLRQSLKTGVVTTSYPRTLPEVSRRARGKPEIDWANWQDARPAAAICPTGAIECRDESARRSGCVRTSCQLGERYCTFSIGDLSALVRKDSIQNGLRHGSPINDVIRTNSLNRSFASPEAIASCAIATPLASVVATPET